MFIDPEKLKNIIEWETVTPDTVTINVNGEELKQLIYDNLKITIDGQDNDTKYDGETIVLRSNDIRIIEIHIGNFFSERDAALFAIQLQEQLNTQLKKSLCIGEEA